MSLNTDNVSEKKKILIVDDDEIQLMVAEVILDSEYDVKIAKSGEKALEHLYKGLIPNLILLDILMPEMDGFEVYNRIRAISLLQNIPIVFLTSVEEPAKVQQAVEIGAADYIVKPYVKENLLSRISNAIHNYEKRENGKQKLG